MRRFLLPLLLLASPAKTAFAPTVEFPDDSQDASVWACTREGDRLMCIDIQAFLLELARQSDESAPLYLGPDDSSAIHL